MHHACIVVMDYEDVIQVSQVSFSFQWWNETSYLSSVTLSIAVPYAIQHQQGVFSNLSDILDNQHLLRVSCISSTWVTLLVVKIFVIP